MTRTHKTRDARKKRQKRIRSRISGTGKRPRMALYRSNNALYVQLIDDEKGITLLSGSIKEKDKEAARKLGADIAKNAVKKKIHNVVFDRGGHKYHGVIKELADAARKEGLQF